MKHFTFLSFIAITLSISSGLFASDPRLHSGSYLLKLSLNDSVFLPIQLEVSADESKIHVVNDTERIETTFNYIGDSLYFHLPVFNSYFACKLTSDTTLTGNWYNLHKGKDYILPVNGAKISPLPVQNTSPNNSIKYEITFSPNSNTDSTKAIGLFSITNSKITGTILTETGDYRYLDGIINGTIFSLSCFDGSHAFHFTGTFKADSITNGMFYSGKHWSEPWVAIKKSSFELRNPESLTYLNPGYNTIDFTFPDLNKQPVSLKNNRFKDKVVIIQLMGSWCPNCLDESKYLSALYDKYQPQGLEIIALAYEAKPDFDYASARVKTLKDKLGANYTFLIAGTSNKKAAQLTLPMLNQVMSFPTTIILNRKGMVTSIYTGFYGPSTGAYYTRYQEQTERLLEKLLAE